MSSCRCFLEASEAKTKTPMNVSESVESREWTEHGNVNVEQVLIGEENVSIGQN